MQDKILTVITARNGVKCLTSTENRRRTLRYCVYRLHNRWSEMLTKAIQHKLGYIKSYKIVQSTSDGMNIKCTTVKSAGLHWLDASNQCYPNKGVVPTRAQGALNVAPYIVAGDAVPQCHGHVTMQKAHESKGCATSSSNVAISISWYNCALQGQSAQNNPDVNRRRER